MPFASLKRKNKKLEEENKRLREQLKVAYADVYNADLVLMVILK